MLFLSMILTGLAGLLPSHFLPLGKTILCDVLASSGGIPIDGQTTGANYIPKDGMGWDAILLDTGRFSVVAGSLLPIHVCDFIAGNGDDNKTQM